MASTSSDPKTATASGGRSASAWGVFVSTFLTIFLAELGDKTQVTTLLMTVESHRPWIVFTGAATALISTSLLGVLVGRWLAQHIAPRTLDVAAGGTLLAIATALSWDLWRHWS